jgi:hypothetical protein
MVILSRDRARKKSLRCARTDHLGHMTYGSKCRNRNEIDPLSVFRICKALVAVIALILISFEAAAGGLRMPVQER